MTREPESLDHPSDEQHVTDAALALARLFARQAAADMQGLASEQSDERADEQDQ